MRQVLLSLIALSLLSSGVSAQDPPTVDAVTEKVSAVVAKALEQPYAVGVSVAVARDGELILERGYGLAEAEHSVAATPSTLFRIGSVTKQFTAAAILKLVEDGRLELDARLETFVEFPTQGHEVTVRHLLNHTSGIMSYTNLGQAWVDVWPLELSDEKLLGLVKDRPFEFKPGERWSYSNTGYYLLGMILEKVTGKAYGDCVRELLEPLDLPLTRYDSNRTLIPNRAQGYGVEAGHLANDAILGMRQPGGAGGLISTAGELVKWSLALSNGQVLKPASYAQMIAPTTLADGSTKNYGFGLAEGEFAGLRRVQHSGGIMGFNSMLFWFPESGVHVAVISNSEGLNAARLADDVARAVLGITKAEVKDEPISQELRQNLIGSYTIKQLGLTSVVSEQGKELHVRPAGQGSFRLLLQSGESLEFRASFDTEVKLVFAPDGQSFELTQAGQSFRATRD